MISSTVLGHTIFRDQVNLDKKENERRPRIVSSDHCSGLMTVLDKSMLHLKLLWDVCDRKPLPHPERRTLAPPTCLPWDTQAHIKYSSRPAGRAHHVHRLQLDCCVKRPGEGLQPSPRGWSSVKLHRGTETGRRGCQLSSCRTTPHAPYHRFF
jgi:hypothetical protein